MNFENSSKNSILYETEQVNTMGKGDKKTRRGKIWRGSYGVLRPRIKKRVQPEAKVNVNKKAKAKK